MSELTDWLLEGPSWVQYRVRLDLMGQPEEDPRVISARKKMIEDSSIKDLLEEVNNWPWPALKGHKDASHPIHKLAFISDLGFRETDPAVSPVVDKIISNISREGIFQVYINIPTHFGGSGKGIWTWMLCDAPLILYCLIKLGLGKDKRVLAATEYLADLVSDNGWRCIVSQDIKFRGPGRKDDPCPYATLLMLKLLSQLKSWSGSDEAITGAGAILDLWEQSSRTHPYMFYMGTDFRKLKAPLIWYDILNVLDVLTRFDWLKDDPRLKEMIEIVKAKSDKAGRFTPESIYTKLKGWEFTQKKQPSRWLTFLAARMLKRYRNQ